MPHYGIVSISPRLTETRFESFDRFYNAIGRNTGNLLFTNAVWRQIGGEKERINFEFDADRINARFEAVIIPAANWVSPSVDFGHVAASIENLKIPVVVVGLGAQSECCAPTIDLPEGTQRFLRAVFDRSASVSVRGEFTAQVLKRLGYSNVRVTGCPSLYCDFRDYSNISREAFTLKRCLVHATRYSAGHAPSVREESPNRALFRFARTHELDILFQSESEELAILFGFDDPDMLPERTVMLMKELYLEEDWEALRAYILAKGRAFLDVEQWGAAMANYRFVYGTRLHGTIMALNSGVPAMLLWHDSRTREIAEFAAMPSMPADDADISEKGLRNAYERLDLAAYAKRRTDNQNAYLDFLKENGVAIAQGFNVKEAS